MASVEPSEIIADLRRRAQRLLDAACAIEEAYPENKAEKPQENGKDDRRTQLIEYLKAHGPTKRADLIVKSGIPAGTLASLLRDEAFKQVKRGVWRLRKP